MKKFLSVIAISFAVMASSSNDAMAQRRTRPGAMKHTQQEVENALKVTKESAKYIRDGSTFVGDIFMVGDVGGVKLGTAIIEFSNGKYKFSFTNEKFNVQEKTKSGIKYWKKEKLGEDFSAGGKYEVIERHGNYYLYLYQPENPDEAGDKIPLNSKDAKEFELAQDNMLMRMHYAE